MNKIIFLLLINFLIINKIEAQNATTKQFNLEKSIAIQGYDPVNYFIQSTATKGKSDFVVVDQGVKYFFASANNKELFLKNPIKYEPQYGGWCAYAMGATNNKVEIDPKTFKIVDGKLYLFYHDFFNNTLPKWNKDEQKLKINADKNWLKINH